MASSINKLLRVPASLGVALLVCATPALAQEEEQEESVIEAIRVAMERFKDVNVALEEGYIQDPSGACTTAEMEGVPAEAGAMGIHYFRPDLLGITATEPRVDGTGIYTGFLNPAILLYEPQEDGSLELVAVENLVFKEAWEAAGNTEPPVFAGHTFIDMEDDPNTEIDEAHGFAPHYDLHVWVFRENPNGAFESFNPAVSCEHGQQGH